MIFFYIMLYQYVSTKYELITKFLLSYYPMLNSAIGLSPMGAMVGVDCAYRTYLTFLLGAESSTAI